MGITEAERDYAQRLVNLIESVETEGIRMEDDLKGDGLKVLMKAIMR